MGFPGLLSGLIHRRFHLYTSATCPYAPLPRQAGVIVNNNTEIRTEMPSFTVEQNYEQASVLLKAMSNPHRLLVLCHLTRGEKCVGDLEALVGLSQSALSQHLARLRHDGLVKTRRDAQTIFYSLRGEKAQTIINTLAGMFEADAPVADDRLAACS